MPEYIKYILTFLLNTDADSASAALEHICYTDDHTEWKRHKIVIIPSKFFSKMMYGESASMPEIPLQSIEDIPLLYGTPEINRVGGQLIVKADIVASTFFLITRYEELINDERDENGRFRAESSLLYKSGALQRPVVDEYSRLLRGWLEEVGVALPEEAPAFRMVVTHDVDRIAQYKTLRGFAGGVLRGHIREAVRANIPVVGNDPLFTFDWMRKQEEGLDTEIFVKVAGNKLQQDLPYFDPKSNDLKRVLKIYKNPGIHISYEASKNPERIKSEVDLLSEISGTDVTKSRHHYLASLAPKDYQYLIYAGITDDYTMGFASQVGFRLGTSRPVRWINPETRQVTSLTLHPLVVMDRTLYDERYMHLSYDDALKTLKELHSTTAKFGGEFVTLWHNSEVSTLSTSYARQLFEQLVKL